jgi:hypothetical protein
VLFVVHVELQHLFIIESSMLIHPGVYCLRSNGTTWDAATLWRTYETRPRACARHALAYLARV